MTLDEVRKEIDAIDPQIRALLMRRMDCSREVVKAKLASGETRIYRKDREEAILARLSQGVPADRLPLYLALVRKVMEESRAYQYGILFDALEDPLGDLTEGLSVPEEPDRVLVRFSVEDRPGSMAPVLSVIGDAGFDLDTMERVPNDRKGEVSFELAVCGSLTDFRLQKLLFMLSRETRDFRILKCYRFEEPV